MQAAIAAHGHNLVYGLDRGHYREDDAVGLLLTGLRELVSAAGRGRRQSVHVELR